MFEESEELGGVGVRMYVCMYYTYLTSNLIRC